MKYLVALVVGMLFGAVGLAAVLYYNPFVSSNNLSPLSVTDNEVVRLSYSAAAQDALMYTNPRPDLSPKIWPFSHQGRDNIARPTKGRCDE